MHAQPTSRMTKLAFAALLALALGVAPGAAFADEAEAMGSEAPETAIQAEAVEAEDALLSEPEGATLIDDGGVAIPIEGADLSNDMNPVAVDEPTAGVLAPEGQAPKATEPEVSSPEKEKLNGWLEVDGKYYWYDDGVMAASKEIYDPVSDAWYWIDADGVRATNKDVYIPAHDKWVRYDESGRMIKGEDCRYGGWYYFDLVTGAMQKGFVYIENLSKWVFYDRTTGQMLYGEQYIDEGWYYLTPGTGAVDYGWTYLPNPNKWVYYDTVTGRMVHGWAWVDNAWKYFNLYTGVNTFTSDRVHDTWMRIQDMYSATDYLLTIDTNTCHVTVFEKVDGQWGPLYDYVCSVGASSTPTPKGQFNIGTRGYSFGDGYTCYYWTQFNGSYLFHSILYNQGTWTVQDGRLGSHISHGCVRLAVENARWIYNNVPKYSMVYSF